MITLDSNVFIYIANGTLDCGIIADKDIAHASVVRIESLGFKRISGEELQALTVIFGESYCLPLTETIADRAIAIRQAKTIGLGDAIIAATALEHDCELWTANTEDFADIEGLKLHNPLTAT